METNKQKSLFLKNLGVQCRKLPDVGNANTAYLDMSFLYGSDEETALNLRSTDVGRGLLKTQVDLHGRHFPHISEEDQMVFADARGDVHPAFTLLHTVFLRHHNHLAKKLIQQHPSWNDETIFQEARKINVAILQHITYTQYLDALLGEGNNVTVPLSEGHMDYYDKTVDGSILTIFSTAAFRYVYFFNNIKKLLLKTFHIGVESILKSLLNCVDEDISRRS